MAEKLARPKELRTLPPAELNAQLEKLRQALWQQRVKVKDGTVQQTHHASLIRRQVARIHTLLREQQLRGVPSG